VEHELSAPGNVGAFMQGLAFCSLLP
jgi:hypothetical protein